MNGYVEIARFYHAVPMEACVEVLSNAEIPHQLSDDSPTHEAMFSPSLQIRPVSTGIVTVPASRLVDGRQALLHAAREEVSNGVDPEYFLNSFDNQELSNLLMDPWENSDFDLAAAEKLLQQRGTDPPEITFASPEIEVEIDGKRALPGKRRGAKTVFVYGFIAAIFGGVWGAVISWNLAFAEEKDRGGRKCYVYDDRTRLLGKLLFAFSILVAVGWIILLRSPRMLSPV